MYYIIFGLVTVLGLWTIGSHIAVRSLEEPSYIVLEKRDGYEIRQYDSYIVAETEITSTYNQALNGGFSRIADYIFGNNTSKTSIAMTAPVLETTSEKIAMTVPVTTTIGESQTRNVSFVLPSKYTLDTLPAPTIHKSLYEKYPLEQSLRCGLPGM